MVPGKHAALRLPLQGFAAGSRPLSTWWNHQACSEPLMAAKGAAMQTQNNELVNCTPPLDTLSIYCPRRRLSGGQACWPCTVLQQV